MEKTQAGTGNCAEFLLLSEVLMYRVPVGFFFSLHTCADCNGGLLELYLAPLCGQKKYENHGRDGTELAAFPCLITNEKPQEERSNIPPKSGGPQMKASIRFNHHLSPTHTAE